MNLKLLDVEAAFLYGELDEEVHLGQPVCLTVAVVVYVG